jgi:hypothetical protein
MKVESKPDGSVVVRYDSSVWSRLGFGLAGALVLLLVYELVTGKRFGDGIGGLIGGIATALVIGTVVLERSVAEFDVAAGVVRYTRRWAWKEHAGTVRFADISHVMTETPIADKGIPSRRIVLVLHDQTTIPLTAGYSPDVDDKTLALALQLRSLVGVPR